MTYGQISAIFIEHYVVGLGLTPKDQAVYYLIYRYWDKVSQRLKDVQKDLFKKAQVEYDKVMTEMMNAPSFLSKIKRPIDNWQGGKVRFPL